MLRGIKALETYKVKAMAKGEALESMISAFKKKNKQLDVDLQMVRKEFSRTAPAKTARRQRRPVIHIFAGETENA